eukprot:2338534-Ditylum_brightwellii.AAC.1
MFAESIHWLPGWGKILMQHIYEQSNSSMKLKEHLECTDKIYLVTDRGMHRGLGYFWWAIATETTILWIGFGQAQGNPSLQKSLRMEGISHLSLLRFLLCYITFHGITIQQNTCYH